MATVAPTDLSFFTAWSTTPALRGAAPDVNNLRERKSYLFIAERVISKSGTWREVLVYPDDGPKLEGLAEQRGPP
jgi:hypothetical protein